MSVQDRHEIDMKGVLEEKSIGNPCSSSHHPIPHIMALLFYGLIPRQSPSHACSFFPFRSHSISVLAQDLQDGYGRRRGANAGESVSGTAVLYEMYRDEGFGVSILNRISPRIESFDTCVWFPDRFDLPTNDAMVWSA